MKISDTTRMTATEIAQIWGVTKQAVSRWFHEAGCPRNADGTYNLMVVVGWHIERIEDKSAAVDSANTTEAERYRRIKADQEELKLQQMRKELVSVADVNEGRVRRILEVKSRLLSFPKGVANQVANMTDPHEIEEYLESRIIDICNQFARGGE